MMFAPGSWYANHRRARVESVLRRGWSGLVIQALASASLAAPSGVAYPRMRSRSRPWTGTVFEKSLSELTFRSKVTPAGNAVFK
jgi:hypothetical protein